jgi:hopene-associated glycosyltransferase HpnB
LPVAEWSVPSLSILVGAVSLAIWLYLVFLRGFFWRLREFDDDRAAHRLPDHWPAVVAIVPARNEAETIGRTAEALAQQEYPGLFSVIIVDDHSDDGTAGIACRAAAKGGPAHRIDICEAAPLPAGWTGKLSALHEGVSKASADAPAYYWFTDADIVHAPDTLRRLVARAEENKLDLASLMVLLRADTFAERALIPPFLYFFLKLYPPRWIADGSSRTAGAAGGCILLRRETLERVGGLAAVRGEVIDDCALARAVKGGGGRIWMGLTRASLSLRSYRTFAELRDMIARTAFTQLRYSTLLLVGTLASLLLTYVAPVALLFAQSLAPRILGLIIWLLISLTFLPTVRFHRLSPLWAPLLPLAAAFYAYATWLSAWRYWLGRGGQWKGRAQAPHRGQR